MLPRTTKLLQGLLRILYFFVKLVSVNVNVFETSVKKKVTNKNINLQTQITMVNKYSTLKYMYKRKIFLIFFFKFLYASFIYTC